MSKSKKWLTLANEVLQSLEHSADLRGADSNAVTKSIMLTCMKTLLNGDALSEKQAAQFVENIRKRTGRSTFEWTGPIILSRDQRLDGRKAFPHLALAKTTVGSQSVKDMVPRADFDKLAERVARLEAWIAQTDFQPDADPTDTRLYPDTNTTSNRLSMDEMTLEPAANCDFQVAVTDATKRNETQRNHGMPLAHAISHEDQAIALDPISTGGLKDNGRGKTARPDPDAAVVSIFQNGSKSSGNLEIMGAKFCVMFAKPEAEESKITASASPEWLAEYDHVFRVLRRESEKGTGAARNMLSALYAEGDTRAKNGPKKSEAMAALLWDGEIPKSVIVWLGYGDSIEIPLEPFNGTKPHSPTFKGKKRLAA